MGRGLPLTARFGNSLLALLEDQHGEIQENKEIRPSWFSERIEMSKKDFCVGMTKVFTIKFPASINEICLEKPGLYQATH